MEKLKSKTENEFVQTSTLVRCGRRCEADVSVVTRRAPLPPLMPAATYDSHTVVVARRNNDENSAVLWIASSGRAAAATRNAVISICYQTWRACGRRALSSHGTGLGECSRRCQNTGL